MMDDKPICYRCRSEIYHYQGTAYYGYYIAHSSPDDCTAYLNRKIQELEAQLAQEWRPVTEPPTEKGLYLVYDADGERFFHAGIWPYRVVTWRNGWGSSLDGLADYWRPLPPPPSGE